MALILFLVFSVFLQGALGEIICEELPVGMCSFSIASSGKRCLLETYVTNDGRTSTSTLQCKTSEVVAENMKDWIESDECISACGAERKSVGISSDSLLEPRFTSKLCSPECHQKCRNIVDLYHNLALGEGVFLPDLCKVQQASPRRAMTQFLSSGAAAGPIASAAEAPTASLDFAPGP
ncbi:unnamed protein product, partial [Ilex paraguariensis]